MVDFQADLVNFMPMEEFFTRVSEEPDCYLWRDHFNSIREQSTFMDRGFLANTGFLKLEKLRRDAEGLGGKTIQELRMKT